MSFRELDVWKRSARLSAEIYKALASLKDYGFRDQITRSGLSISSNIAEGYGRGSIKETVNFLYYAKCSAAELETQTYIGMEIGYIEKETGRHWLVEVGAIQAMLGALIKAKSRSRNPEL